MKEIERKFLVTNDDYKCLAIGVLYRQGYLVNKKEYCVRVRLIAGSEQKAFLAIKAKNNTISREEMEYQIPVSDAIFMLDNLVESSVEKYRFIIPYKGFTWEVDEFIGNNLGLVTAEIELPSEDAVFEKPDWIGEEVSDCSKYLNSNLSVNPYSIWKKKDAGFSQ